ncbi:MAG: hypothetical protein KJ963_07135 [Bacteroidetes bacterium]|nr:hypothetical protein [Bacteroidota bacterium]
MGEKAKRRQTSTSFSCDSYIEYHNARTDFFTPYDHNTFASPMARMPDIIAAKLSNG